MIEQQRLLPSEELRRIRGNLAAAVSANSSASCSDSRQNFSSLALFARFGLFLAPEKQVSGHCLPSGQGAQQGVLVGIFQIAADRQPSRQVGDLHTQWLQLLTQV